MTNSNANATLDAVIALLEANALTAEDLQRHAAVRGDTSVTVGDYVVNTVLETLTSAQRKTLGPYLALLVDGYPDLCACSCDACLAHFRGDSTWTACPCRTSGDCRCAKRHWQDAEPHVEGCATTFTGYRDRSFAGLTNADLMVGARWAQLRAQKRAEVRARRLAKLGRPTARSDGRHAVEQLRAAASVAYRVAMADSSVPGVVTNVALEFPAPKRPDNRQRAFTMDQLEEIWQAISTSGGNDPELDALIVWTMLELGARRSGLTDLTIADLEPHSEAIRLDEKNHKVDSQPASPALILTLLDHALRRGGTELVVATIDGLAPADVTPIDVVENRARLNTSAPVLYYTPRIAHSVDEHGHPQEHFVARPLTHRRFQHLFDRLKRQLPWLDEMHGRPHDLRHTGATFIERAFGTAVAQRWLRHTVLTPVGLYVTAGNDEARQAHAWWIGATVPPEASAKTPRRVARI